METKYGYKEYVHEAKILSMIARGSDGIPGLIRITGETQLILQNI